MAIAIQDAVTKLREQERQTKARAEETERASRLERLHLKDEIARALAAEAA